MTSLTERETALRAKLITEQEYGTLLMEQARRTRCIACAMLIVSMLLVVAALFSAAWVIVGD